MANQVLKFRDHAYPGRGENHSPLGDVECLVRRAGKRGLRTFRDHRGRPFQLWLPTGKVEEVIQGSNIVTNRIKTQLSHLIVGHENTTRYLNKMAWGTGGHASGDPTTPISPSETDTSLEAQILIKNFSTFEHPSSTSVRMTSFILEAEANGFTITEEALVAADNTLCARRTFPGLPKTEDFVFEFRHTIIF